MKKLKVASTFAGVALLAMAGSANAMEFNIYGASAEFNFWSAAGIEYLNNIGCATVSPFVKADSKDGIIYATGCPAVNGVGTDGVVTFRVSNKASYDGIFAVSASTDTQKANGSCALTDRPMADMPSATSTSATLVCKTVTIGASDVPASAFVQTSSGALLGPLGGAATVRNFNNAQGLASNVAGLQFYQPVKVPFGFFVTNNVTVKTCTAGPTVGDYCNTDADCGKPTGLCNGGDSTGTVTSFRTILPTDNITREMATQMLSNSLPDHNWSDFAGFGSLPQVACVRHAGSGSHAVMDLGLMNKPWGAKWPALTKANQFYFNDGTGDLLNCMSEIQKTTKAGSDTVVGGAFGYADADVSLANNPTVVGPLKYNGNYPNSQNIKSGVYDLYADQTLYVAPSANTTDGHSANQGILMQNLMAFLNTSDGANLESYASGEDFHNFWASSAEMKVGRGNTYSTLSPFTYPARGGQNPTAGE